MQDDLIERCGEQHGMCLVGDDCGNLHTMWEAETALIELRARIAALEAKLAEKDALLRECGEGLAGPNAWLERWASHVGGCNGGSLCQCGLTLARLESATTLAKIKDATDAD